MLKAKYGADPLKWSQNRSYIFRVIQKLLPTYRACTKKTIGDGNHISFWFDNWLDRALRNSISGPLPLGEDNITISIVISVNSSNTSWKLDRLPFKLPIEIELDILATLCQWTISKWKMIPFGNSLMMALLTLTTPTFGFSLFEKWVLYLF